MKKTSLLTRIFWGLRRFIKELDPNCPTLNRDGRPRKPNTTKLPKVHCKREGCKYFGVRIKAHTVRSHPLLPKATEFKEVSAKYRPSMGGYVSLEKLIEG